MGEELRKISFIDGKITELEAEKVKAEKDLASCRSILGSALISKVLGESFGSEIPGLRKEIAGHEQRINEIDGTIIGLKARRTQEEERHKANEADKIRWALKQIDLECYRAYREELIHTKAVESLRKAHVALQLRRDQELAKLSEIGVDPGLGIFVVNNRWFEADSGRALLGKNPWQDIETDDGIKFIDEEIARLEKEISQ